VFLDVAPKLLKSLEARPKKIITTLLLRIPAGEARRPGGGLLRRLHGLQYYDLSTDFAFSVILNWFQNLVFKAFKAKAKD